MSDSARQRQIVVEGYNQIADRYLAWARDFRHRERWLAGLVDAIPHGGRVLDLGCGAGVPVADWLAGRGYAVVGIDGSTAQIKRARSNVPLADFAVEDMARYEADPGSFDAVVAFYSITHVPRHGHAALFSRIYSWLRPGGIFLASLGAGDSPDWIGEWLGTTMYFSHFDAETNLRLLQDAGFVIERNEIAGELEDGDRVDFLWVAARKPDGQGGSTERA